MCFSAKMFLHDNELIPTTWRVVDMKSDQVMDYQNLFSEMAVEVERMVDIGNVASYIPELRDVDPNKFGIHLTTIDNQNYCLGDSNDKFSIQSISKVFSLALALEFENDKFAVKETNKDDDNLD